jgi:hypothetical protein
MQLFSSLVISSLVLFFAGCGGNGGGTTNQNAIEPILEISLNGFTGTQLLIRNDDVETLAVSQDGVYSFQNKLALGKPYTVAVIGQANATKQLCRVLNGNGVVSRP